MRCTCDAAEWAHHHVSGGVYPCEGYTSCRRCREIDQRLWRDVSTAAGDRHPKELAPVSQETRAGREYLRRHYGTQTTRARYGRD